MTANGHEVWFGSDLKKLAFENLIVVMVVQFCKFTKKKITELYTLGEFYGKEIIPQ